MSKIVTRQKTNMFMGVAFVPVRIDRDVTIQSVVDELQQENNDIEIRFLEDGSVQL